ncbi:MAG: hypothetical protein WBE61_00060 [Nitrososphaeraceae archaeon]
MKNGNNSKMQVGGGGLWKLYCILVNQKVLGENLLSKKFKAQKIEAGLKVMLYNKFMGL